MDPVFFIDCTLARYHDSGFTEVLHAKEPADHRIEYAESQKLAPHWIEQAFQKRECSEFIPTDRDPTKCGCGRALTAHGCYAQQALSCSGRIERWTISRHTRAEPTDAFGTIEFQGGPHPHKAQYVRLGFDSDPEQILKLFEDIWGIEPPKLVITVHGGIANFSLQPKLARVFKKGLLKAAKTTGAWIITSGINAGSVRHVAAAIGDGGSNKSRSKIVTIGIAPWGLLKKREELVGKDVTVSYHAQSFSPKGRFAVLNDKHSYFLLVDNGTLGRYGADIILRKRLEEYISKQTIEVAHKAAQRKRVPVVCVVLEGGTCTIRSVLDYVTNIPPVPVVVCDGSGRAADLLAFAHQSVQDDGAFPEGVKPQLSNLVQSVFGYDKKQAAKVIIELELCVKKKHLVTVFRLGEDLQQDVDHAILTALLKGLDLQASDQLSLALAWNRVDIARSDIFVLGQDWPKGCLESAMMEALLYDRVEFVKLLLENGVSMEKFLTVERLEELYNTDKGPSNTMAYVIRDVVKIGTMYRYNLPDVGLVIEKLMGSAFVCTYRMSEFRSRYQKKKQLRDKLKKKITPLLMRKHTEPVIFQPEDEGSPVSVQAPFEPDFKYPFNELLIWSVLMKRQEMARLMWQHGEEALAKSLIACKLYKSLAKEAADDYLEVEICDELRRYADEFRKLALELLEHCHKTDDDMTFLLLTYELNNWGKQTCLSLAVMANHKEFLAHPSCQILLADLWHGGLRIRRNSNLKVLAGLFFPPYVLWLDFKTKEELLLQPQTAEEHEEDMKDEDSGVSGVGSSDEENGQDSSSCEEEDPSTENSPQILDVEAGEINHPVGIVRQPSTVSQLSKVVKRKKKKHKKKSSSKSVDSNKLTRFQRSMSREPGSGRSGSGSFERRSNEKKNSFVTQSGCNTPDINSPVLRGRKRSILERARRQHSHAGSAGPPPLVDVPNGRLSSGYISTRTSFDGNKMGKGGLNQVGLKSSGTGRYSFRDMRSAYEPDFKKTPGASGIVGPGLMLATAPMRSKDQFGSLPQMDPYAGPSLYFRQPKYRTLPIRRKFYEFYVAPITTFWFSSISYLFFLICFTYTVLIRTPPVPEWPEIYVIANVISLGVDMLRKLCMTEPVGFAQKLRVFCSYHWNWTTSLGVMMFLLGFALRMSPERAMRDWGRVLYCCNICFWYLRLFDLLSANSKLGPYITMVGKMVMQMYHIITILTIVLMAFGTLRQSILFPDQEFHWKLVRNIFYKPYFMLYGEVYAGEIDTCGDENTGCVPGGWITVGMMAAFLLVANILLISLLIAVFNNIYTDMSAVAHLLWKFQRYQQVMEYEAMPFLPPPLILFCDIYLLIKYCCRQRKGERKRWTFDYSLKLFLEEGDVERVHDFEEESMDDLAKEKEFSSFISTEERIRRTADRSEFTLMKLNDMDSKETSAKSRLATLEERIEGVHSEMNRNITMVLERQQKILDALFSMTHPINLHQPPKFQHQPETSGLSNRKFPVLGLPVPEGRPIQNWNGNNMLLGIEVEEEQLRHKSPASTPGWKTGSKSPALNAAENLKKEQRQKRSTSLSPGGVQRRKLRVCRTKSGTAKKGAPPKIFSVEPVVDWLADKKVSFSNASSTATSPVETSDDSEHRKRVIEEQVFVPDSPVERTVSMPVRIPTISTDHSIDIAEDSEISDLNGRMRTTAKDTLTGLSSCPPALLESPHLMNRQMSASPNHRELGVPPLIERRHSASSMSYRRNDEYTSITDTIINQLARISEGDTPPSSVGCASPPSVSTLMEMVEEPNSPSLDERVMSRNASLAEATSATDTLHRAKPSFVVRQNALLKEFEETSSRITLGLIQGRKHRESQSIQSNEDLKDMGLADLDIDSYIDCLKKGKETRSNSSSSLDSLSSARLEDEEGFQQINECLMQQEEEKSRTSSACRSPQTSKITVSPEIDSPGPSRAIALSGSQSAAAIGTTSSLVHPTPTHWSHMGSPLTSPGRSKAGQIFTFDTEHLKVYLSQLQQDEKVDSEEEEE